MDSPAGRGEASREALLLAAMEEFGMRGLEGARTRAIARRAGMNMASINYHFGGKEGLYGAVVEAMADNVRKRMGGALAQADELEDRHRTSPVSTDEAASMVVNLVTPFLRGFLEDDRMAALALIMLREQMRPTPAFDIFFDRVIGPVHTKLTRFVAGATGIDPESDEAVIRAHTIIGQVLVFRTAREALLRRTGWQRVGEAEREAMIQGALDGIRASLRGFRKLPRKSEATS